MTPASATSPRAADPTIPSDIATPRARLAPGDIPLEVLSRQDAWSTRAGAMVSTLVVLLLIAICSLASWSQTQTPPPDPTLKVKPQFFTSKDRQDAIRKAAIYTPKAVAEVDIMTGPAQKKKEFQFHMNDTVTCEFVTPGQQMGGNTPKFLCKILKVESLDGTVQTASDQINDDPLKVKFGDDNREVYAEIVSSRLLWALGFYTDAWYPIRVDCTNCPADPESGSGARAPRTFKEASVVRKLEGHKMVETGNDDEGWSWKEFETLNGSPTYEKDGLKLMAAFISHSDNKPPQQRLVCDTVNTDTTTQPPTVTCHLSQMVVQDVGATFGGGGAFTENTTAKINIHEWSQKPVWKKVGKASDQQPPQCQATLHKSLTAKDGLDDPMISEEGRRFTAGLMCQLSDQQITDMFKLARVSEMPEFHNSDGSFKQGMSEDSVVQQWVTVFKQKREDIAAGRCQWKSQPADLNVIENPANLPTVPNNCVAKVH
jgi:hypothetical protein